MANSDLDLLYGVAAIASALGMGEKACRHRIEKGIIPSFKVGGTICSRRSTLQQWLTDQEAAAAVEGRKRADGANHA